MSPQAQSLLQRQHPELGGRGEGTGVSGLNPNALSERNWLTHAKHLAYAMSHIQISSGIAPSRLNKCLPFLPLPLSLHTVLPVSGPRPGAPAPPEPPGLSQGQRLVCEDIS